MDLLVFRYYLRWQDCQTPSDFVSARANFDLLSHTPADLVSSDDLSYNPEYREEDKQRFYDPENMKRYRKTVQGGVNKAYHMFVKNSPEDIAATKFAIEQMSQKLNHDKVLYGKMIPKWELGCRRITPGVGYLEAFTQPNVHLTNFPINGIEPKGIRTKDDSLHDFDVVICATGFDVSQIPPCPVIGRHNTSRRKWKK